MPGILPMKVIKVGTSAQSRIAQACDRCRSKKIRCDGVRPCCSQCANVGFECKTSDKLSRRAFPRGYTESLEERVRALETEVRELKDLLDEKDEKIDMLSRIHSQSTQSIQLPSPRRGSATSHGNASDEQPQTPEKDEVFKVQQSPYLLSGAVEGADSYFSGTSSGRTFIEAFKHRVQETGRSTSEINTEALLTSSLRSGTESPPTPESPVVYKAPPRLVSDQLVNIFFQEWAPLFPVLHRPAFLALYEKYVADSDAVSDKTAIAQLNLVFGIAALSNGARSSSELQSFERQWRAALDATMNENTMATLQALILAQIFCIQQGDLTRLLTYKGLSTSLSARLGLHQSQKRFALGTLTCETRKKVFWTLYTVDCFSAVMLGLPKQLKDDDIQCEYPADADDEYVTERGFQPTLPGESTKLSSALALFRAARILSKVLEEVFPAKTSYELSLKKLTDLSDELEAWSKNLAPHLRLHFAQDKPSTGTISSRSPLLSLTYHYIRALIQRPAICASLGSKSSSSMLAMASSCKHMVQIIQLLEERGMCFSFCLNKDEVLVLAGFGLLFQGLGLESSSKILKDNHRMTSAIVEVLNKTKAPCAPEFSKVARSFLPTQPETAPQQKTSPALAPRQSPPKPTSNPPVSRHNSEPNVPAQVGSNSPNSTKKQLKAIASRFSAHGASKPPRMEGGGDSRRASVQHVSMHPYGMPASQSQPSLHANSAYNAATAMSRSEPARSPLDMYRRPSSVSRQSNTQHAQLHQHNRPQQQGQRPQQQQPHQQIRPKPRSSVPNLPNLDYLAFGADIAPQASTTNTTPPVKTEPQLTDWEKLLGSLDNGETNIFDASYGGPAIDALMDAPRTGQNHGQASELNNPPSDAINWDADFWETLCQTNTNNSTATGTDFTQNNDHPDSIFSASSADETARLSADDLTASELRKGSGDTTGSSDSGFVSGGAGHELESSNMNDLYKGIVMPAALEGIEDINLNYHAWDAGLGL
ncbi:hypothetical protein KC340_g2904 [Hortaea werneckii]|nr:hypothetical protein KC342_g2842 [Hortaea werneckii]KAI7108175.1 hypothetical protein KC339_g1790 [Hortaea werneckii]KAI7243741.1 hypothetical protein KC365_g2053 [Hortaea werneckii]KAI7333428.1 hypothetical protein KC340_g2904 [Hortaea werneckii]KAI7405157.1 hypothetical protein KC328_g1596 [Hortaea werneckii]